MSFELFFISLLLQLYFINTHHTKILYHTFFKNAIEPVINIQNESVIRYNYAYIPDFKRYYFIKKITSLRKGLWTIEFEVDPLMSFKGDILALQVVVDKQSSESIGDEYIDDGSLVADNYTFKSVYNFNKGFNDHGEYILITAG